MHSFGARNVPAHQGEQPPVTIVPVVTKSVPVKLYAIGNVEPYTTVAVKARVDGQIVAVKFKEGDEVKQGAILRPFRCLRSSTTEIGMCACFLSALPPAPHPAPESLPGN
jgi:pyruvate carboxylase